MINVFRQNPDWGDYVRLLKEVDQLWRDRPGYEGRLSVFGPRPSWTDTIARSRFLFDAENWSELDEDQVTLIAPTHVILTGDALLGSIGRRSTDVRSFLFDASRAEDRNFVLQRLKAIRGIPATALIRDAGRFLGDLCEIRGVGKGFATRLMTLARPDTLVVVNGKSHAWLSEVTGMSLMGKIRSYQKLIDWLCSQRWHASPEPNDQWEKSIWRMRAALLDTFGYYEGV